MDVSGWKRKNEAGIGNARNWQWQMAHGRTMTDDKTLTKKITKLWQNNDRTITEQWQNNDRVTTEQEQNKNRTMTERWQNNDRKIQMTEHRRKYYRTMTAQW